MKRISDKARKRYAEAKPIRDGLRAAVGKCEVCDRANLLLDVHEISRGVHRQKSLDKLFALLVVCRSCHELLGYAKDWSEAKQLALLAEKRLHDWSLKDYLQLTSPKAPRRIEYDEVAMFMTQEFLKVEEVANKLRVNRRTVQAWIDSGILPAVDVRPDGSPRAMWRIRSSDLLRFADDRVKGGGKPCE